MPMHTTHCTLEGSFSSTGVFMAACRFKGATNKVRTQTQTEDMNTQIYSIHTYTSFYLDVTLSRTHGAAACYHPPLLRPTNTNRQKQSHCRTDCRHLDCADCETRIRVDGLRIEGVAFRMQGVGMKASGVGMGSMVYVFFCFSCTLMAPIAKRAMRSAWSCSWFSTKFVTAMYASPIVSTCKQGHGLQS